MAISDKELGEKPHWTVDRRINISNLVGVIVVLVGAVIWNIRMEGRVNQNAENIDDNAKEIVAVEDRQQAAILAVEFRQNNKFIEIKNLLQRIEDKLDRKADK